MIKKSILIVEDDRIVAEGLKINLIKLGYEVVGIVSSGEDALNNIELENPDLVLMDIMLAGEKNGIETAENLRSRCNVPVIYLTAYADEDMLSRAKMTEPFGYIIKPYENMELKSTIEIALYKHEMETKLRQSEEWLSTTLKSIGDAVIATNAQGKVMFINPVAQSLTGWCHEDASDKPLAEVFNIINEQSREVVESPADIVMRTGKIVGLANHTILIRKDGKEIPIDDSAAPIKDEKGNISGIVLVFRDITERKQAEEERVKLEKQLHQSQKMEAIGTLAGGIAHDFNNLLAPILGYAQLAKTGLPSSSEEVRYLDQIEKSANRAKDLVKKILIISRSSLEETESVQLKNLVEEVLSVLRSSIPKNIEICQEYDFDLPLISTDPSQMYQVILNLCTNAVQSMTDGGELRIKLNRPKLGEYFHEKKQDAEEFLCLSVQDHGCGMEAKTLERIYEPFFTTKDKGKQRGTGLGLSIVSSIIQQHGGHIEVESDPGIGTIFRIYLPVLKEETTLPPEKPESSVVFGNEHILLVDDEKLLCEMGTIVLEKLGYKVTTFMDSQEALKTFESNPQDFQLVITDYTMPNLTGPQLMKKIKAIRSDIPMLLITGYSNLATPENLQEWGCDGILSKPYDVNKLAQTVSRALAKVKN